MVGHKHNQTNLTDHKKYFYLFNILPKITINIQIKLVPWSNFKANNSGPRGPGFNSHVSLKLFFCIFDGRHD